MYKSQGAIEDVSGPVHPLDDAEIRIHSIGTVGEEMNSWRRCIASDTKNWG